MISYAEALDIIAGIPKRKQHATKLSLETCLGHVTAEDIRAPIASPLFTNSAMDGFAYKHEDFVSQATLHVRDGIYAGDAISEDLQTYVPNSCVRIMTGAPVPEWADTVVPVERTSVTKDVLTISEAPSCGTNIRRKGEDIEPGELLLPAGSLLRPEHVMLLANFGIAEVSVADKPRVAIFSTGDELREIGDKLNPGEIYNSSRYFLTSSLKEHYGIAPDLVATLPDQPATCAATVRSAIEDQNVDVLITTGAVSAGEKDFIPELAKDLGFRPLFHKVAVRPGKPIFLAVHESGKIWLGLPGNPISTATGWHFFVRPLLANWADLPHHGRIKANVISDIEKPGGLTCFFRAQYSDASVSALPKQGSAHFLATTKANAYIVLSGSEKLISAGTCVDVQII